MCQTGNNERMMAADALNVYFIANLFQWAVINDLWFVQYLQSESGLVASSSGVRSVDGGNNVVVDDTIDSTESTACN